MEENYSGILWEGYGLRFMGGRRTRSGFLCKTNEGLRELKKTNQTENRVLFEYYARKHLRQKGFLQVNEILPTTKGQPFLFWRGTHYILEEALEGAPLEENKEDFLMAAKVLATFHEAGKGFSCPVEVKQTENLSVLYEKRRVELQKIRKRIGKQKKDTPIDVLVRTHFKQCSEHTEQAQKLLEQGGYEEILKKEIAQGQICHNRFKGANLRQDSKGTIFVTGLEDCGWDIPCVDLAVLLRRYMKKTDGEGLGAMQILRTYEEISPLSDEKNMILRGMLTYPNKFLKLCNLYYNKRRTCISPAMTKKMSDALKEEEIMNVFLQKYWLI